MNLKTCIFRPLLAFMFIPLVYSCEQVHFPAAVSENTDAHQVFIETRTTGQERPEYPIRILAFRASDGRLAGEQTLADTDESLSISLPEGTYNLFVFAGVQDYDFPEKIERADQEILLTDGFTQAGALMYGRSYVNLQEKDVTVSIQMNYPVCKLSCTLHDIPDDVDQVDLNVSPIYRSMILNGEYTSDEGSATIPATPTDQAGVWQIPETYLWGTTGSQTVLSVQMSGEKSGTQVVSSTLKRAFEPSFPYLLSGSFRDGVYITGELEFNGWQPPVEIPFYYGEDETGGAEVGEGDFVVDEFPVPKSVWNNYIVAGVTELDEQVAELLLISRVQWAQVSSASGADPEMAARIAATYTEGDLADWRIPTKEEAEQLRVAYEDPFELAALNNAVIQVNGNSVLCGDDKISGVNVRYLCDGAQRSFPFGSGGSVSIAGEKRTYHLRLVRTVQVVKR